MLLICKKIIYILIIIILSLITNGCSNKIEEEVPQPILKEKIETIAKEEFVYIDIKGAVLNPGVYKVNTDSRVIDAINISGGLKDNADTSVINLSKKVIDEMTLIIYSKEEIAVVKKRIIESKEPTIIEVIKEIEKECICPDIINEGCINEPVEEIIEDDELVNINTASVEQLMTLTGIGESKANDIIEYRSTSKFNTISDIKNVTGIGDSTFEKIKDLIKV